MKLNKGEVICPHCNGTGMEPGEYPSCPPICSRCWNSKKLDWIELLTGKENPCKIPITKTKITPKARQLKATWTIEMENDLQVMYSDELWDEFAKIENKE